MRHINLIRRFLAVCFFIYIFIPNIHETIAQPVSSVEITGQTKSKFDSTYIESYHEKLVIGFSVPKKNVNFSLSDVQNDKELMYQVNTKASLGFKASYKWLGISVGFGIPQTHTKIEKYGKTEGLDLQLNTYLRKFVIDAYFQYYKGFYLENMDKYFSNFDNQNQNYYQRPDLTYSNVGLSVRYVKNNKKFSYKASYDYNEIQKRRAGSLIIGGYAFLSGAQADSLVVPSFATEEFSEKGQFSNIAALNVGFSIGYTYTFVYRRFFLTLGFVPGIGLQTYTSYNQEGKEVDQKNGLGINTVGRASLGYNKNRFYAALSGVSGSNNLFNENKTAINFGYGNIRFTVGYRFTLKKKLF
jgi:hypothetical protein